RRQVVTVDRLPERDIRRDDADLVALQPTDEMPARCTGVVGSQRTRLRNEVLRAVLADVGRTRCERVAYRAHGDRLGHDHQSDVTWITAGVLRGSVDARPNRGKRF